MAKNKQLTDRFDKINSFFSKCLVCQNLHFTIQSLLALIGFGNRKEPPKLTVNVKTIQIIISPVSVQINGVINFPII